MRFVRLFLALDVFTTEFVICLCNAEKICCKLCSSHVVQYLLVFLESFAFVDILHSQAVVKSLVTAILEHGVIYGSFNTGRLCRTGKEFVANGHFVTNRQAFFVFRKLCRRVRNFLLPGFNSKICLTQGNHFFAGVSVHHNQVTSVTGKLVAIHFSFCTTSDIDHLAHVGEMVSFIKAGFPTCFDSLFYHG